MNQTLAEKIRKLGSLSAELNDLSDEANETLRDIERELVASEPGVSVWINKKLAESPCFGMDGEMTGTIWYELGFEKIRDGWHVVARFVDQSIDKEPARSSEPMWILNAPRFVRVQAMGAMDELVMALTRKVEEFLGFIRGLRK